MVNQVLLHNKFITNFINSQWTLIFLMGECQIQIQICKGRWTLIIFFLMFSRTQKNTCLENHVTYLCFTIVFWTCRMQTTGISDLKIRHKKKRKHSIPTMAMKLNSSPLAIVNRDDIILRCSWNTLSRISLTVSPNIRIIS